MLENLENLNKQKWVEQDRIAELEEQNAKLLEENRRLEKILSENSYKKIEQQAQIEIAHK